MPGRGVRALIELCSIELTISRRMAAPSRVCGVYVGNGLDSEATWATYIYALPVPRLFAFRPISTLPRLEIDQI